MLWHEDGNACPLMFLTRVTGFMCHESRLEAILFFSPRVGAIGDLGGNRLAGTPAPV